MDPSYLASKEGSGIGVKVNPEKILRTLDDHLDHEVRLIIYGRAALHLGFEEVRPEFGATEDVDGIVAMRQLEALENDDQFWEAIEATNQALESEGLYITHLFQEDQVFLRADWESRILPVSRPETGWLRLFRPATLDLILTKMMRGDDEQDMNDVEFMIGHDRITPEEIEEAFRQVVIPDVPELRDAFEKAVPVVRQTVMDAGFQSRED